jgi:hypothetical protein
MNSLIGRVQIGGADAFPPLTMIISGGFYAPVDDPSKVFA